MFVVVFLIVFVVVFVFVFVFLFVIVFFIVVVFVFEILVVFVFSFVLAFVFVFEFAFLIVFAFFSFPCFFHVFVSVRIRVFVRVHVLFLLSILFSTSFYLSTESTIVVSPTKASPPKDNTIRPTCNVTGETFLGWYDTKGNKIGTSGRKRVVSTGTVHTLVIEMVNPLEDGGIYECRGSITNATLEVDVPCKYMAVLAWYKEANRTIH